MTQPRILHEGLSASDVDQTVLADALHRLATLPDIGDDIALVVAADIGQAIRVRLPADQARIYDPSRISGVVGAKTIPGPDGTSIVIDGRLLSTGLRRELSDAGIDVPRIVEHEGWHHVLDNRGESFHAAVERLALTGAHAHFVGQGLVMIDEYRVERALRERGLPLHESYIDSTGDVFAELATELRGGRLDLPVPQRMEVVMRAFNALTTHMTYLAGAGLTVQVLRGLPLWNRYVGDSFDETASVLEAVPSAAIPTDSDLLDATAATLGDRTLPAWLERVGFTLEDIDGGDMWFESISNDFV
jgi:hypothetical protein